MAEITYDLGRVMPVYQGEWNSEKVYETLDWVISGDSSYMCISPTEVETPLTDTVRWALIAKGQRGSMPELNNGEGVTVSYDTVNNSYTFSLADDIKTMPSGTDASDFAASTNRLTFLSKATAGIPDGQSANYYAVQYNYNDIKVCIAYGTEAHEIYIRHMSEGVWSEWRSVQLNSGSADHASTASALITGRTIALTGDISGSTVFDGSQDVTIQTELAELDTARVTTGVFDTDRIPPSATLTLGSNVYNGKTAVTVSNATSVTAGLMSSADKEALDTAVSDISDIKSDINDLDGRIDTAENDIDTLETATNTASQDIDSLKTRMNTAEQNISSITSVSGSSNSAITALNALLNGGQQGQIIVSDGSTGWHWAWLSDVYMQSQ